MLEQWLTELGLGLRRLFVNPLLYWGILLIILTSYQRIKKERKEFGQKVFDVFSEIKKTWKYSLVSGLVLSVCALGIGFVFSFSLIIIISTVMIVLTLNTNFKFTSSAYSFTISFLTVLLLPTFLAGNFPPIWVTKVADTDFFGFLLVMGILLLTEAVMLIRLKSDQTFPERFKGKRGKWIGRHRLKKLAIIPIITLVPGGLIEPIAPWWPVFDVAGSSYGLIILPLITGFEHTVQGQHPIKAAKGIGTSVLGLAIIVIGLAVGSIFWRPLTIVAIVVALAGREFISYWHKVKDRRQSAYFQGSDKGLQILGIIPGSPADQLGLKISEIIIKANGERISDEREFYYALQKNSAFCKLEVLDESGEIKFTQRAMYQGEHHRLGVLFTGQESNISPEPALEPEI